MLSHVESMVKIEKVSSKLRRRMPKTQTSPHVSERAGGRYCSSYLASAPFEAGVGIGVAIVLDRSRLGHHFVE